MVHRFFKKKNGRVRQSHFVEPDEIILDSHNLANFDQQQFEGRIEKPISKQIIFILSLSFILLGLMFISRLFDLQISRGEAHFKRSENNNLTLDIIFAERGIIYDRNEEEIAWNKKQDLVLWPQKEDNYPEFPTRAYLTSGFSHMLGHVSLPAKDAKGIYWDTEYTGRDGLELQYNDSLRGLNGSKIVEINALGNIQSENIVNAPARGQDLHTSIDSRVQVKLFELIQEFAEDNSFVGGAGIILDVRNGEIITSTSYPEYSGEILSLGQDKDKISSYLKDDRNVFLDRTISGLYTPGSIVKPIFALAALEEGIIDPFKKILSTGSIEIPNPYFPDKPSIFKDWKAHGWTDLSEAIAVSSDVYFYNIGGGFEGQKGLGIANLEKYAKLFGVEERTGIDLPDETSGLVPNPEWKLRVFDGDPWRLGDTYNTAIGQYGFQVTPMEIARATAALANGGTLVTPHFVLNDKDKNIDTEDIYLSKENLDEVLLGMREAVTFGTAVALNVPYVEIAGKTGTAQTGIRKSRVNSWVTGFFPYEDPQYAFVILMDSGPSQGEVGASRVMRGLVDWMYWNTPEYFGLPPWPEAKSDEEEETLEENLDMFMLIDN